ncbi:MAG: polysaccharide deacetylase family protein [Deltaproteobacteria bacterium]|nr:polysaccharide deacetylase family protein [Deltaproteobacteria bacterium]
MTRILGLKIDVDTYRGMKKGVPRLLDILDEFRVRGTFYLSVGPDASGRALLQLFRNPLFLKKMLRTNAPGLYGFRTALYGTLLPSPMIALSFPRIVRDILSRGHEVQFHAWDHRRWQDELSRCSEQWIREWFEKGIKGFTELTGKAPSSFGAPAWLIDDRVLDIIKDYRFEYLSCTRAKEPFIHAVAGVMEIPSDLPCFEEIGVDRAVNQLKGLLETGGAHVLPVHAEVEGGIWDGYFIELLREVQALDYRIVPLNEIRNELLSRSLPVRKYRMELLPGRSVPCAV